MPHFAKFILAAAAAVLIGGQASAQSLNSRTATPLSPGENHGTVDSMVGAQYWLINCHKGKVNITVRFKSMGLFGNATAATIQVALLTTNGKLFGRRAVTSNGGEVENDWPGSCSKPSQMIVEISPPGNTLVRTGGDYVIVADGDGVDLGSGGPDMGPDRIVGTYAVMVCAPDWDCQNTLGAHFSPDGGVRLTDGHAGHWTLFDPDAGIYTIQVGPDRFSMKLVPGRGLFNTTDMDVVVFQAVR